MFKKKKTVEIEEKLNKPEDSEIEHEDEKTIEEKESMATIRGIVLNEEFFGPLYPYVTNDDVTDIKWNGRHLWIDDLNKGRFKAKNINGHYVQLDKEFVERFCKHISNMVNNNFNTSEPSLKAETSELRIQAEHPSVCGDKVGAIAIRKTPAVSRLRGQKLSKTGYASEIVEKLLPCLMRGHLSGVVIGDVGSGKTELEKYMCEFIPETDGIVTVEDTLELRLCTLYPEKDIYSMRITENFTSETAIRDALRLMTKWLIISEARGREIKMIMEGASTGCTALTSIHAENTWEIPDRIMNMAGDDVHAGFENDIYTFFDYAIKVKREVTPNGIKRSIDQLTFFDRDENGKNHIYKFVLDGKLIPYGEGKSIVPARVIKKFASNKEVDFLALYQKYLAEYEQMRKAVLTAENEKA